MLQMLLVLGCLHTNQHGAEDPDLPNFYQVDDGLYRGGRPREAGFQKLKEKGIKTVISLEPDKEASFREQDQILRLGMSFYNFPMNAYERPSDDLVHQFLDVILDAKWQSVFVHCDTGKDLTGTMAAVYRVIVQGWGPKDAYNEAKRYGFWPYRGDAVLKKFIHQLKDRTSYYERVERFRKAVLA